MKMRAVSAMYLYTNSMRKVMPFKAEWLARRLKDRELDRIKIIIHSRMQ